MSEGFSLCRPQGCWARLAIAEHRKESVLFEDGTVLRSASLSRLLRHSTAAAIMAATVGPDIVAATEDAVSRGDGAAAVTYDAVGAQTAEATMSWINDFIRQQLRRRGEHLTKHRFSPGYGDFELHAQQTIYGWLRLEQLGLRLTPSRMLIPEKSVTALAGIERTSSMEETHDA